jgi:hypothetical protein
MNKSHFDIFLRSLILILLIFSITYYSTNYLAGKNNDVVCISLEFEKYTPYLYIFYIPYYGAIVIYPIFFLTYNITSNEITIWRNQLLVGILIASAIHLIFPTINCYTNNIYQGFWWNLSIVLVGKYNMIPSIHAMIATISTMTLIKKSDANKLVVSCYFFLIIISTLLTHQHGIIDILIGIALGIIIFSSNNYDMNEV